MTVEQTGDSTAEAFDVAVSDTLPAGLTYAGNLLAISGPGPAVTVAGATLTFSWSSIPLAAGPYQFTFAATVDATVVPGQTFLNVADLAWSTLPGSDPDERTYADSDPAELISASTTLRDPAKNMIVTSESSTPDAPPVTQVAIGEIVRYRLQAELTEGTFPSLTFVDTLPLGLSLLDLAQVRLSFTSDVPMTADPTTLESANGGAIPPTFTLPAGRVSTVLLPSGRQQITFDLGDVTNHDNDLNAELVTLEFNVLVDNTADSNAGEVKTNAFQAFVDGTQYGTTQSVSVTVVEPRIANVAKQFVSMSGNQRTFQVSFSNTGTATAFDTLVTDTIPAGATLNVGSIVVTLGGGAAGPNTSASTAAQLAVSIGQMPVGSTVVIQYSVTLTGGSQTGLLNSVDVTTTSLPGPSGTLVNPTGSVTPGVAGDPNGERTGAGGMVNDLVDDDDETLGSLGDLVWYDLNADGNPTGEPGLPLVDVTAVWAGADGTFGTADDVTLTTTTDLNGIYFFNALPPGPYRVTVDTADTLPRIPTYDLDGGLDSTTQVSLGVGQNRTDVDFGYTDPSTITGFKYRDTGNFGTRDPGEPAVAGVRVYIDANNNGAFDAGERTTVTAADGSYTFGSLLPGSYVVRELRPDYTIQTQPGGSGEYTVVILVPGSTMAGRDFGNRLISPQLIDDGDPGFSFDGDWGTAYCPGWFQADVRYFCAPSGGGGTEYAQWQFTGLTAGGTYQVSTTWAATAALSAAAPYTVSGGAADVTTLINQQAYPSSYPGSFTASGVWWANLTSAYMLTGPTLTVRLAAVAGQCVAADAVRIQQLTTPEITLLNGGMPLVDGTSSVNMGGTPTYVFTVRNDGGDTLQLGTLTVPAGFLGSGPALLSLAPGQSTTFTISLDLAVSGLRSGPVTLGNNDNNEAPFDFTIQGQVGAPPIPQPSAPATPPPAPLVATPPAVGLSVGGSMLTSRIGTVSFGSVATGAAASRTFTVTNTSSVEITLSAPALPAGYSLPVPYGTASLAPGQSTTFTVGLNTAAAGTFSGTLTLSTLLATGNYTLFSTNVTGTVTSPVTKAILDDGDAGFTAGGFTTYNSSAGYLGDVRYALPGTGSKVAQWQFTLANFGLTDGLYRVSTLWYVEGSRADAATYQLYSGAAAGTPQASAVVNHKVAPRVDVVDLGRNWQDLGAVLVSGGVLTVTLSDATTGGAVVADAIRIERLTAPEIQVELAATGVNLADGSGAVNFGSVFAGSAAQATLRVKNVGAGTLTLAPPTLPAGFSLVSGFGSTALAANDGQAGGADETNLTIALNTTAAGSRSGLLSFANNDANENPFDLTLQGTVSSVRIVDDGDSGFVQSGSSAWVNWADGYQGDLRYSGRNTGRTATWTFTDLPAGTYRVSTTWIQHSNRATNATYTISDGGGAVAVNQELAPSHSSFTSFLESGRSFADLRAGVVVSDGTLVVSLSDVGANEYVIADAVRIERVSPLLASAAAARPQLPGPALGSVPAEAVARAIAYWAASDPAAAATLGRATIVVADLPERHLGLASPTTNTVWLDADAGGYGWSLGTGQLSWGREQGAGSRGRETQAGGVDLGRVLAHEFGHLLGLDDLDSGRHAGEVMAGEISPTSPWMSLAAQDCSGDLFGSERCSPAGPSQQDHEQALLALLDDGDDGDDEVHGLLSQTGIEPDLFDRALENLGF